MAVHSADVQWMVLRNNSSFIVRKRNIGRPFSTEPNNLRNLHSFRYNGLIHDKVIGVNPAPDNKGFVLVHKKRKYHHKPGKMYAKSTIKHGAGRAMQTIRNFCDRNKYCRHLKKQALRRASAIIRSQKPKVVKKKPAVHKKPE